MQLMKESPKANEEKYEQVEEAWKTGAAAVPFGMTLAEFQAKLQESKAARTLIDALEDQLRDAAVARDKADVISMGAVQTVVKNVVANEEFGDDSALYENMGYVRKSQRKSGLTRKKKPAA